MSDKHPWDRLAEYVDSWPEGKWRLGMDSYQKGCTRNTYLKMCPLPDGVRPDVVVTTSLQDFSKGVDDFIAQTKSIIFPQKEINFVQLVGGIWVSDGNLSGVCTEGPRFIISTIDRLICPFNCIDRIGNMENCFETLEEARKWCRDQLQTGNDQ